MIDPALIGSANDIIGYIKGQHGLIRGLFERVRGTSGEHRVSAFRDLRRLMAIHEAAEEEIVHPVAERVLVSGRALVAERLHEERDAKLALVELEGLDVDSPRFARRIEALERSVLAHADKEETVELARLAAVLNDQQLRWMRRMAQWAESIAPTRPHPGLESLESLALLGPLASLVDRTLDALHL